MTKRPYSDVSDDMMNVINILTALNTPQSTQTAEQIRHLIPDVLSHGVGGQRGITRPAGEFTVDEIVRSFGLDYNIYPFNTGKHVWTIEDSELDFTMTPHFKSLMSNYGRNFDRSSEAACRTGLDLMLNECLTVMKGNYDPTVASARDRQRTPTPFDDLRIYSEVAFNHKILPLSTSPTRVSGRLDYGIGRILNPAGGAETQRRRRFQCFLAVVEAKPDHAVGLGVPQLLTYLACLRQSRLERKRTDASVYGVSSDGYQYLFVTITHAGIVKMSDIFNIVHGKELKVLGWLKYILEETTAMSPTEKKSGGSDKNDEEDLNDLD
ncbi:hypothetical protein M378DRAFT_111586 [Amanita muscaria Koide BX008]|uniref:Uncharacterized protein n=1 Tax=Amanita muscaria (strain Koide BX008) TaxID=946122 RepID=A0A0C2SXS8_AMAMK|nr:hypothetical protein M378DRAFT_111586 [Amanita muscaria Koide BX008]